MLALGVYGGRVVMVDDATGEVKWTVQAHPTGQSAYVAMSPGGRFVASVGLNDRRWKLWDASGEVHRVGATHDGTGACICEVNQTIKKECPVVAHTRGLRALAFSPCGHRLATGGLDGAVIVWDARTGEAEHRMQVQGASQGIFSLTFSMDRARLASGTGDGSIFVWAAPTWALLRTIPAAHEYDISARFSTTDCRSLASAGCHGVGSQIHFWDVDSGEKRSVGGSKFVTFSADGRYIATGRGSNIATGRGSRAGEVQIVDVESGALMKRMHGHIGSVFAAAFSVDDGSKLASGSGDCTCKVWDSSTGALLQTINVGSSMSSVAWERDWVRDEKCVAFTMGHHPRLGAGAWVLALEVGVVRMILDRV
jgi:WD40 repeat protein